MLGSVLCSAASALVLLTTSANALPRPAQQASTYAPARDLSKLAHFFPQIDGLPVPGDLQLKYVALGVGTQNYTCPQDNPAASPGTTGAVARLFDIGSRLNDDQYAKNKISYLSAAALALSSPPWNYPTGLQALGYNQIGRHFFANVSGTYGPVFALDQLQSPFPVAIVSKINEVDAPPEACTGENKLPAIKWLYLRDTRGLSQGGINTVYRVETAGGNKPATCQGMPATFEVKYAAQYWIFGPKA